MHHLKWTYFNCEGYSIISWCYDWGCSSLISSPTWRIWDQSPLQAWRKNNLYTEYYGQNDADHTDSSDKHPTYNGLEARLPNTGLLHSTSMMGWFFFFFEKNKPPNITHIHVSWKTPASGRLPSHCTRFPHRDYPYNAGVSSEGRSCVVTCGLVYKFFFICCLRQDPEEKRNERK